MSGSHPGTIVWVTPHGRALIAERGWSTRPARLARELAEAGSPVVMVARTKPWRTVQALRDVAWRPAFGPVFEATRIRLPNLRLLEHTLPPGAAERWVVDRIIRSLGSEVRAVVVSDPRSASVFVEPLEGLRIFDAYDAWDLSPLYRHRPARVSTIRRGYRLAADHADLVVANTQAMADRMRALGARRVEVLPNAGPEPATSPTGGSTVIYLGNVQGRLRLDLAAAAADAAVRHGTELRIVGAVQEEPAGWGTLLTRPGVAYRGPRYGAELDVELAQARVGIVPHRVDDYTRSQDAMKAWDYLARGLAIVSTSVPPASDIPGLAAIADDPERFGALVAARLADDAEAARERLALAAAHTWRRRARELMALLR